MEINYRFVFPFKKSVNSKIPDEHATVSYCEITDAIPKILELGRGTFMAKFDIKRAYRLLPEIFGHAVERQVLR